MFNGFLVFHDSVEQYLDADLAVKAFVVTGHVDVAAGYHLAVQRGVVLLHAVVEIETVGDFTERGLKQHLVVVEDDDGVDEVFHILHLVGGDDDGAVFRGVLGNDLAEEGLRGNVEAVGRLVKEQIVRVES